MLEIQLLAINRNLVIALLLQQKLEILIYERFTDIKRTHLFEIYDRSSASGLHSNTIVYQELNIIIIVFLNQVRY